MRTITIAGTTLPLEAFLSSGSILTRDANAARSATPGQTVYFSVVEDSSVWDGIVDCPTVDLSSLSPGLRQHEGSRQGDLAAKARLSFRDGESLAPISSDLMFWLPRVESCSCARCEESYRSRSFGWGEVDRRPISSPLCPSCLRDE